MNEDLKFHIRSLSRFVYYVTDEEDRFIEELQENLPKASKRIHVFNSAFGMMPAETLISDWKNRSHKETTNFSEGIHGALTTIYKDDPKTENFYVITDPDRWMQDPQVVRRLLNIAHQLRSNDRIIKILFFVGPRLVLPQKLQRYFEVVHDRGLSEEELRKTLGNILDKVQAQAPSDTLVKAFKGLTSFEVDAAISQSVILTKKDPAAGRRIDPKHILEYKRRQLRKTELINYVDVSDVSFDKVGGAHNFKEWAKQQKAAWTDEGQKFGLTPPKGALLLGVWGCGKSLSAKALGNEWKLPVVQFELGKLRQSGVGDSEANIYKATSLIESVSPCIVWVDEAEKSLSGSASSSQSDAGTTSRQIGIFSTWLQETQAKVCLVMTANTLSSLPPEFIRRTNESFFFDLPTEEERVDILKIHLTKQRQDPAKFNLAVLSEVAKFMVGSEIEKALEAAMILSFDANKPALDEGILTTVLKTKPRIFRTLSDDVKQILDWVGYDPVLNEGVRARFASNKRGEGFQEYRKNSLNNG